MIALIDVALPIGIVVIQITIIILVGLLLSGEKIITRFIGQYAILFAFMISIGATLGSLFYSEIMAYPPCSLCWWQRIFMYPQVILLGIALWIKNEHVRIYSGGLAIVGGVVALYHSLLQMGLVPSLLCTAEASTGGCAQRLVFEFGYVTLPLMSLSIFILIIVLMFGTKFKSE